MHRRTLVPVLVAFVAASSLAGYCDSPSSTDIPATPADSVKAIAPTSPIAPTPPSTPVSPVDPVNPICVSSTTNICTNGVAHFVELEGGFWVVKGDNGQAYDPIGGLPEDFRTEGVRVKLVAKPRHDVASFHMYGTLVEIISISKLP